MAWNSPPHDHESTSIRTGAPHARWVFGHHCVMADVTGAPLRDRARGALLGTFVGDAVGMPYEGAHPEDIPEQVEMLEARLGRGTYTDDTQMMIALAESLLENGRVDEDHLGRTFVAAYDPRRGYGSGTEAVLALIRDGVPPTDAALKAFDGGGSMGNGAAMRIAPVAVRFAGDQEALLDAVRRSAVVTHAHRLGVDAAAVQATAIAAALRGEDAISAAHAAASSEELRYWIAEAMKLLADRPAPSVIAAALGTGATGPESVPAAIYAAAANDTFVDAVSFAVRLGGDTDTIAAMCGAIAGARCGASAIPTRWLDALENGDKGRSHVESLADRLVS